MRAHPGPRVRFRRMRPCSSFELKIKALQMKNGFLLLAGLTLLSVCQAAQPETTKVVCFGDSITNRGYYKVLEVRSTNKSRRYRFIKKVLHCIRKIAAANENNKESLLS
jgi:hypothetical protein